MKRKFKFNKNYYDENVAIFKKGTVQIESGLTILVGCNGSGKTTLIDVIMNDLEKGEISYKCFDNLNQGGSYARDMAMYRHDMAFLATAVCSSEGENIIMNIGRLAGQVGDMVRAAKNAGEQEVWLLLDAIDSGLSIDNIISLKQLLFKTMIDDCRNEGIEPYIVVAANEYELACGENCFDVYSGKYLKFRDYDDYRKFILQSKEEKERLWDLIETLNEKKQIKNEENA